MSYEKIHTGLFGEDNRLKREQIYEQFVPLEGNVFLCMYFGKLNEINSQFADAPKMQTPQAKGMVRDVCFILKLICKEEINEKCGIEETSPAEEKTDNSKQPKKTQRGRAKNKEPLLSDVVSTIETLLCTFTILFLLHSR